MAYATRSDLYLYGLPRGLLANPGRLCASASSGSEIFTLDQHGFEDDDQLLFRAEEGGSLPGGVSAGTTYYCIRLTDSTFKVSASSGGSAVNLSSDGTSVVVSTSLEPLIDAELERVSRLVDTYIPGHLVPFTAPYPKEVVAVVAKLAAASILAITGQASALITAEAEQTRKELSRLMTGLSLRDPNATAAAHFAVARNVTSNGRGWDVTGGTIP